MFYRKCTIFSAYKVNSPLSHALSTSFPTFSISFCIFWTSSLYPHRFLASAQQPPIACIASTVSVNVFATADVDCSRASKNNLFFFRTLTAVLMPAFIALPAFLRKPRILPNRPANVQDSYIDYRFSNSAKLTLLLSKKLNS